MALNRARFAFILVGVIISACSQSSSKQGDALLPDAVDQDVDSDGLHGDLADTCQECADVVGEMDSSPDGDLTPGDITRDSAADTLNDSQSDAAVELTPLPVEPALFPQDLALYDGGFIQEHNHTWNEMEPGVGELVALLQPPPGYEDWDLPTLVSPQGLLLRDMAGVLEPLPPDPGLDSPVVAAAASSLGVFVATSDEVYSVTPSGEHQVVALLPEGDAKVRLVALPDSMHILKGSHWAIWMGEMLLEPTVAVAPTAIASTQWGLLTAQEGRLAMVNAMADPDNSFSWTVDLDVGTPVAILSNRTIPQQLDLVVVGSTGLVGLNFGSYGAPSVADVPLFAPGRVPLAGAVDAAAMADGGFAVAASGGVYRPIARSGAFEYRLYAAQRWMPAGEVRAVLAPEGATGLLYFATQQGLGYVTTGTWSIADKMVPMVERIVLRHDRDGAVADSRMTVPGDLTTSIPWDSDNDGGWTCYWVLAECLRYKVTGDQEAKAHFDKSLDRMLSLRTLTGTDYFLARAVIRIDGCILDDCDDPDDGEWFKSPDGEWWVKANTSNDEVTSHMFMMGLAHDLCADEAQKAAIVAHVDGIVGGLVENGFRLVDPQDGEPTSYGQFDPQYVNWWVEGQWGDGGRRSAQILGALNLAHYLTRKQKYLDAKADLLGEHDYGKNIDNLGVAAVYPFCAGSGDCDELALQAMFPLIRYEANPMLRQRWIAAWSQLYAHLSLQQDAFWDISNIFLLLTEASPEGNPDTSAMVLDHIRRWFQDYPTDLIRFPMHNELRQDTIPAPAYYLTKDKKAPMTMRSDGRIFPADERRNDRHNTSQFFLNGGWGANVEMDSADVLFAYWLARHTGLLTN